MMRSLQELRCLRPIAMLTRRRRGHNLVLKGLEPLAGTGEVPNLVFLRCYPVSYLKAVTVQVHLGHMVSKNIYDKF